MSKPESWEMAAKGLVQDAGRDEAPGVHPPNETALCTAKDRATSEAELAEILARECGFIQPPPKSRRASPPRRRPKAAQKGRE